MTPYRTLWLAWAGISLGSFAMLEFTALRSQRVEDTLSAVTRELLGLYPRRRHCIVARPAFVAGEIYFTLWFLRHILSVPPDQII